MFMVSVNGVSMIYGLVSKLIGKRVACCYSYHTYWLPCQAKYQATQIQPNAEHQSLWSDNDFWFCMYVNCKAICSQLCITKVLAAFIADKECNTVTSRFPKLASTERQ